MDIDLLSKMVKELILDNDEVTLPGVGTFVTEIIPSTFSDKGYTINPPYRRLYFRQKQNNQDTLLSDFYAKSNNIDKETARLIISDFLMEMKEILLHKRIIVFPGLGRLRATKENNLFFIADEDLDIYPEGFGLEAISLKTHQETTEEVSQALENLKSIITEQPVAEETETVSEEQPAPVAEEAAATSEEQPAPVAEEAAATSEEQPAPVAEEAAATSEEQPAPVAEEATVVPEKPVPTPEKPINIIPEDFVPLEKAGQEEIKQEEEVKEETPIAAVPKKKGLRTAVWIIIIVLVLCILALAAFIIIGHVAPEWLDRLLYTPEELQIINKTF